MPPHASRPWSTIRAVSDLPSYPREAAEAEEAAALEPPPYAFAGWWSRLAAYLLDTILLLVPLAVMFGVLFAIDPDDDSPVWVVVVIVYLASLVLPFVYFTVMHGNERGQTLGKRALGIRVVADGGGRLGYGRAFGRYAITFVFGIFVLPIVIDYLWPLWDRKRQALHDKSAGSVVVRV
jgi:uncharacterized RDD family membrane protein YckC